MDDWVRYAGVAAVVLAAVWLIRRLFARKPENPHLTTVQCRCGWKGQVSKYKPRCAKCGADLS